MKAHRFGIVLLACLATAAVVSGCSIRAQKLKDQPLNTVETVERKQQTTKSFLIYPLEDVRGGEYGYLYPTSLIPPINFFHVGAYNRYPETSGILRSNQGGRATVTVGVLSRDFPYLLANLMRDMKFTPNATPFEQMNTKVNVGSFSYVVMGKLKTTKMTSHVNMIPLAILGILGVPYVFVNYEVEFEISLFRSGNLDKPLMEKTYSAKRTMVAGLYYNQSAGFDMFVGTLEQKIPEVVKDIAAVVK